MGVLVAGGDGQLGLEVTKLLPEGVHETAVLSRRELDIIDVGAVDGAIEEHAAEVVINAAFTNVDLCEWETERAYAVNALVPRNLARACERWAAFLCCTSAPTTSSTEGMRGPTSPSTPRARSQSAYGRTKLAGEEHVMRLRAAGGLLQGKPWWVERRPHIQASEDGRAHNRPTTLGVLPSAGKVMEVFW